MESQRINVTLEQIEADFGQLHDSMSGVLEAFVQAAAPRNVISSFRNAGISLILDKMIAPDEKEFPHPICPVTRDISRCLTENPFDIEQSTAATVEEDEDENEFLDWAKELTWGIIII
jgi:hypothetical protein